MKTSYIFKAAWALARKGAKKFGGSVKENFAQALREVYKEVNAKKEVVKYNVVFEVYKNNKQSFVETVRDTQITPNEFYSIVRDCKTKGVYVKSYNQTELVQYTNKYWSEIVQAINNLIDSVVVHTKTSKPILSLSR